MKVIDIDINKVIPYEKNPRKNDAAVDKVAESIKQFGFQQPIVVDKDYIVVVGHTRLKASKKLGLKKIPVLVADNLSEEKIKAYRLADNRTSEFADWDIDLLNSELEELKEFDLDFNMDDLGFNFNIDDINNNKLDNYFDDENKEDDLNNNDNNIEVVEDDFNADEEIENIVKPITQRGDVWKLGKHRLMCGDSTNADDAKLLMNGVKAHMCFTDPPYNINYGNIKHPKFKQREIKNDNMSRSDFREFCTKFTERIKENVLGCVYMAGPPGPDGRIMFTVADELMHCSTTVIWNKDHFTLGRGKYQNKYEPIWFGWIENGSRFSQDRTLVNVWDIKRPKSSELHPTMKPIELVAKAINDASLSGDIVFDLFGGSGTTMIACEQINRICYMMELDERYCDVIIKRWEQLTGLKATLENR